MLEKEEVSMEELHKAGFKVELLPLKFPVGGCFLMNNMLFLHVGKKNCVIVTLEGDIVDLPKA